MICKHSSKYTNNSIKHQTFVYTQSNNQTVLFQTIQYSISHLFALRSGRSFGHLNYQVLPLLARVNLRAMAMKGYSALLEPHHQILVLYLGHSLGRGFYPSTEM